MTDSRSLVAGANALFRGNESLRAEGDRILNDPFAHLFAEHDLRVAAMRYGRFAIPSLRRMIDQLQTVHCVRHRSIDELALQAIEQDGFRQVVVVGAGYDMRAWRFTSRTNAVRWFEVDHPATQARKQRCLSGVAPPSAPPERFGLDLEQGSLRDALQQSSFVPAEPACFIVEGLVHYLSPERFDQMLADIAAGSGPRRLLLSFIRTDMYESAPGLFVEMVKLVREIPRIHFTPERLAGICDGAGLTGFRSWRLSEQIEAFAQQARGRPVGVSQDVARVDRA